MDVVTEAETTRALTPYEAGLAAQAADARRVLAGVRVDPTRVIGVHPVALPAEGEPVWERLPREPIRWYDRFDAYRALPVHERSIRAAVRAWCNRVGRRVPKNVGVDWEIQAKVWHWRRRAEAWDEHQLQLERADESEERLTARRARRRRLTRLEGVANDAIDDLLVSVENGMRLMPRDVVQLVKLLHTEQRTEYDDNPATKLKVDGEVEHSHKVYMGWDPKSLVAPPEPG